MFESWRRQVSIERPAKGIELTAVVQEEHGEKLVAIHVQSGVVPVVHTFKYKFVLSISGMIACMCQNLNMTNTLPMYCNIELNRFKVITAEAGFKTDCF